MALVGIFLSVYQFIAGSIAEYYSIGSTETGVIIALYFAGIMIAPSIMGEIGDRTGKKTVTVIAFGISIGGFLIIYAINNLIMTGAAIFLIGSGVGVIEGNLSGVLSDENANETDRVMNLSQVFFGIGAVSGPFIASFIISLSGTWKSVFPLLIVLYGVIALYISRLRFGEAKYTKPAGTGLIITGLLKEKVLFFLGVSIFLYVGIEEGVAFWLKAYFHDVYNLDLMGTYALSGYWGSMIIGRYLASRYYHKSNLFMKTGLILSLILNVTAILVHNSIVSLICFAGIGLGFSVVWPAMVSSAARSFPNTTGTAIGIMMTASAAGGVAIPFLMGLVSDFAVTGISYLIIPVTIIAILAVQMQIKPEYR